MEVDRTITVIDGMTASGKSTCLKILFDLGYQAIPVYSDRNERESDKEFEKSNPLKLMSKDLFKKWFEGEKKIGCYSNEKHGNKYGVKFEDIEHSKHSTDKIILTTNPIIVACLKAKYPNRFGLSILIDSRQDILEKRIYDSSKNKSEYNERINKLKKQLKRKPENFDVIIKNNGSLEAFRNNVLKVFGKF